MRHRRRSIRQQVLLSSSVMIVIVASILVVFNIININTIDEYKQAFQKYTRLSSYYNQIDLATTHMKDFLYTESDESYQKFEEAVQYAKLDVKNLKDRDYSGEWWRFDLLANMTDYFEETCYDTVELFQTQDEDYDEVYSSLLHTYNLVNDTSDTYYNTVTNEMSRRQTAMDQNHQITVVGSFIIAFALIIFMAAFSYTIMNTITKPIHELLKNISKIKIGEYSLAKVSHTNSEMEELCQAFDEMAVNVHDNIRFLEEKANLEARLLEQENENLRKDEQLAQSELRMLQNQINPHFLFNTLNMIYRFAEQEQASKTADLMEKTSALLRYGLEKQNRLSSLHDELRSIQRYIEIQTIRLGNRIQMILEVQESLPDISVPGMILQPLVENSLTHGLKDCMEQGEVIIRASYQDHRIILVVSDNGCGMDAETLEEMVLNHYQPTDGKQHFGLYNVVRRMEMVWPNRVNISLSSSKDCGFEFVATIQMEEDRLVSL